MSDLLLNILPLYGIVVPNKNADLLEKVQHEAARIVTGLTRSVSLDNLYKECDWPSLAIRRKYQKLNFMYKAIDNIMDPEYISDITPPTPHTLSQETKPITHEETETT